MISRIVLSGALILGLSFTLGCKKNPKSMQPDSNPAVAASSNPTPKTTTGGNAGGGGGGNVGIIPSGAGGGIATNPGAIAGGGGGGGAIQAVRKAARRTQALNEMNTLGQVISLMQTDLGRMPTKEQIVTELKQYPKVLEAVNEGAFILTGTTEAGGLGAYEIEADVKPGIALNGGRAARTTPEELSPYFRKN
jgi:hypothetical protein